MGTHDLRLTLLPELDGTRLPPVHVVVPTDTLLDPILEQLGRAHALEVLRLERELEEARCELSKERRRRRWFPWRRRKP